MRNARDRNNSGKRYVKKSIEQELMEDIMLLMAFFLGKLNGKEKIAQFFTEHYLEKVKEDLLEPNFDIEDIMK